MNFTYTLVPSPDGGYGLLKPDGTWNGLVGHLIDGKADARFRLPF